MKNLDSLDMRILKILDWKGRLPVTQIAKLVRSNKDVVTYRIKNLEKAGVIARYYPIMNLSKIGYYTSRLNIQTEELASKEEEAFVKFLDEEIGCGLIWRMDHPFKYGMFIWTKSVYDMEEIIIKIKKYLGPKFTQYKYSLMCTVRQYPRDALFGEKLHTKQLNIEKSPPVEHDELDLSILKEFARDARVSTVEIASKLKIPQPTVSFRIKKLEKAGVIMGYRADINVRKLGYEDYGVEIYLSDRKDFAKLEMWANGNPHTTWLQKTVAEADLELEIEAKGREQMEQILNELREKFPFIRRIIHYDEDYWKITYLP